ncbi:beta-lactamase family protein [Flavobacterium sp. J372]|uniref:serine hydrolase domain-containing protein n=1 Tax=Flavobacterium sp. J372 TaxID=2898436 RepID=UPI00215195E8|nr:serine hydrolase domain-containing protein [Flavobacterium sp. J372]MCR5860735.1 beta-lactamase family protein [Flavobacterium sp. J372]
MKKFVLALLVITITTTASAQTDAKFHKIDSLLRYLANNNRFMGSVAIREKDKVVFERAYGFADLENKVKANTTTKYKIGSITKMFTSAVIFQLIEDKKLTLDTKLSAFYPQIRNADKITIAQLLNHHSGIYNYTNDPVFGGKITKAYTKDEVLAMIAGYPSDFEPGSKAEYSNSNFILLGYIIEDITKKTYKDVVAERIVKKIGLKNTYYYSAIDTKKNEGFSYSYKGKKWEKREEWDESLVFAAGALQSTPADLTQFIKALFDGKVVSKTSLAQMTKLDMGYGYGILQFPFGERKFFGHNGGIEGFSSAMGYYPPDGMSFALLVNGENYDYNDIVLGILSIYYKLPYQFPNVKIADVAESVLKSYEGTYSAPGFPMKIMMKFHDEALYAQATGQGEFPLTPVSNTEFVFDPAGVNIKFTANGFTLTQGGMKTVFSKEK